MTTTVTVKVHCNEDKECLITVADGTLLPNELIRPNGEEAEVYVYDDRAITVVERVKCPQG